MIANVVDQKKPALGEKGQYGYVRQAETKPKRTRKKRMKQNEPPVDDDVDEHVASTGVRDSQEAHMQLRSMQGILNIPHENGAYPQMQPSDHSIVRRSPTEEEPDEEGADWEVKIGDAEPPAWSKRKANEELEGQGGHKRTRLKYLFYLIIRKTLISRRQRPCICHARRRAKLQGCC